MFLLLMVLGLISCESENPCESYQLGKSFEIQVGETIAFCTEPITLSFSKVTEDSRCPENVVCIWQGLAEVEVFISVNATEETFLLSTYPTFRNIPSEVTFGNYKISLKEVIPYPNTTKSYTEKDYSIQLLVEKTEE